MNNISLAIVIPCYNEYERMPVSDFERFLRNRPDAAVCIVNDASTDKTSEMLRELKSSFESQVVVLNNEVNLGKAESVRRGILYCHENKIAPTLAYLDADLATSLEECYSYLNYLDGKQFVFASRILKIGSVLERRFSRFLIGRIIATVISNLLQIKVYDTQCGCKVFRSELAPLLFGEKFISTWLFDVELFSRMLIHFGNEKGLSLMDEIPVKRWVDQGESKVKLTYFFRLGFDLWKIRRFHRKGMKNRTSQT